MTQQIWLVAPVGEEALYEVEVFASLDAITRVYPDAQLEDDQHPEARGLVRFFSSGGVRYVAEARELNG